MLGRFIYNYAFINVDNMCYCVVSSPSPVNRTDAINIGEYNNAYLNKYYYNSTWFERTWNEYDEDGNLVVESGYVDTPWTPEMKE